MADIETHYTDMWKDSGALDNEAREKLYLAIQITKKMKSVLGNYYQDYIINMGNAKIDEKQMKQNLNKIL